MAKYKRIFLGDSENILLFITDSLSVVKEAARLHETNPVASAAIGRLITGAKLMGLSLKEEGARLSVSIDGNGPAGKLIAFSDKMGTLKVKIENPNPPFKINEEGKLDVASAVGSDGFVSVMRDSEHSKPYTGQSKIISGEIAEDLTYYYSISEQQAAAMALGVFINSDVEIEAAGGMMLHVLPDVNEDDLVAAENAMKSMSLFTNYLRKTNDLEEIVEAIFSGMHYRVIEEGEYEYSCDCSRWRAKRAYDSIEKSERDKIIKEDGHLNIHCDYCTQDYNFKR